LLGGEIRHTEVRADTTTAATTVITDTPPVR